MKRILVFAALTIALFSCKKNENAEPFTYTINGMDTVSLKANSTASLFLEIDHQKGAREQVSLTISGLPEGISADFTPADGIPPYNSLVELSASTVAAPGAYPVKIIGTASGKATEYNLNIVIHRNRLDYILEDSEQHQMIDDGY